MTNAQQTSLQQFLDTGNTLKESIGDYFFFKACNDVDFLAHIDSDGFSTIWLLAFYAKINPQAKTVLSI